MIFKNCSYEDFINKTRHKKIIQFGASSAWHYYLKTFSNIEADVVDHTAFIVDNDLSKQGSSFEICGRILSIMAVDELKNVDDFVVLITVSLAYQEKICEQLIRMNLPESIECYSLPLMTYNPKEADNSCVDVYFQTHTQLVNVPKIHSFWFSGEEKPELYKRCIESWHQYCPEFEIIEWNTKNYDVTKNRYMREAFEHRKWAFVSDFARLDVIYNMGGIYMDMDVELTASLQRLLYAECFFCRQEDGLLELGSGFGAAKGNKLVGEMLATYSDRRFVKENGELDMIPQPEWLSGIFTQHEMKKCHDSQVINQILCLSNDFISCFTGNENDMKSKLGVHWHNGGWLEPAQRKLIRDSFSVKKKLIEQYFKS